MKNQLLQSRLQPMEYVRTHYRAVAEEGVSIDTVLTKEYWVHVARMLKPGDEITVIAEDDSYRLHLEVVDCGPMFARVRELSRHEWSVEEAVKPAPATDQAQPQKGAAEYERVWKGPHDMHCIARVSDGVIVQRGIREKAEAERIARNYAPVAA